MSKFQSTLIAAAAGAAALGLTGAASAADAAGSPPSLVVHYSADTFESDASTKAFYRELVKAAERVCSAQPSTSRWVSEATMSCRKQALEGALSQVKNTRLAAIASLSKNG